MLAERLQQEALIAETANVSSSSLATAKDYIPFPENLNGLRILEIGAGTSSTTKELRQRGAYTVALDYNYCNIETIKTKSIIDLKKWSEEDPGMKKLAKQQRQVIKAMGSNPFGRLDTVKGIATERRRAKDSFLKDVNEGRGNYVAALAGCLPFQNDVFDFCFSIEGLTAFPIQDAEIFLQSIDEALRVLKPRGKLALSLWFADMWAKQPKKLANASILLRALDESRIPYEETATEYHKALIVTKPEQQ